MSLRRAARGLVSTLANAARASEASCSGSCGLGPSTSGRVVTSVLDSEAAHLRLADARWLFQSRLCSTEAIRPSARKAGRTAAELGLYWGAAAVFMVGLSWASVPLYKLFCAATGYGGAVGKLGKTVEEKLQRRMENPDPKLDEAASARELRVWFNADVADDMPWTFVPTQEYVRVRPGQSTLVFFTATNKSDKPVTGYSLYNVQPEKAAFYFNKIQCFCFEEQRLRAHESIDMPVLFYIDSELATDWNCRKIHDITLSYSFHKVDSEDEVDDDAPTVIKLHGPNGQQVAVSAAPTLVAAAPAAPVTATAAAAVGAAGAPA